nr:hypothetical protein 2 [Hubei diptera virus 14]
MEEIYSKCVVDVTNFFSYEKFIEAVWALDNTSSPGYPFMFEKTTIGDWLEFNGYKHSETQIAKLWIMVNDLVNCEEWDVLWRCFIKQEPTKSYKIESSRYRLIMCPPLHLQVLWQMVFAAQNAIEISKAYYIPSQQGISMPYGRWKLFYEQWKNKGITSGTDATAWDWNLPGWMIRLDLEFRKRLVRGSTSNWEKLANKLYENAFRDCKIIFSCGTILQQQSWGVMKSGCVNTISTNSHCGVFYHFIYCFENKVEINPLPSVVGDDKLQHPKHCENIETYEKYGMLIKSVSDTMEFVGHEFRETGPCPMYIYKHIYNLLYQEDDLLPEVLDGYLRLYANSEEFNMWYDIARELGLLVNCRTRTYYKSWYNSPNGGKSVGKA